MLDGRREIFHLAVSCTIATIATIGINRKYINDTLIPIRILLLTYMGAMGELMAAKLMAATYSGGPN